MSNEVNPEDAPDAWVGVSPEYQNYSEISGKPFAAPGEDDPVFVPTPDTTATVNPDGSPAGFYAAVLEAQAAEAPVDEPVDEPEVQTIEAPVNVVAPSVPTPPTPGE